VSISGGNSPRIENDGQKLDAGSGLVFCSPTMSHVTAAALNDTTLSPVLFVEGEDRRRGARVPLSRPVKVGPAGGTPEALVSARDLSREGMFVDADRPVRIGARFCVQIALDDESPAYVAQAEVAYNREHDHGTGFGVRFLDLEPDARAKIDAEVLRQTQALLNTPTLVPSILHSAPDVDSDVPTLLPSASQFMIKTDEVPRNRTEVPTELEPAEAVEVAPSLPPEPGLSSDLVLADLPIPEPMEIPETAGIRLKDYLRDAPEFIGRTWPGILLIISLFAIIVGALMMLTEAQAPVVPPPASADVAALSDEARAAPDVEVATGPATALPMRNDTHDVLMGNVEPALLAVVPKDAPAEVELAQPVLPRKRKVESKPAPEPAKTVETVKPHTLSPAARALLSESAPRVSLTLDKGARVLKTHVYHNPERFVVDLVGQDSRLKVPAANGAITGVRTGKHPDFVRVVVDVSGKLEAGRAELNRRRLTLQLHLE
jgi:hypothetical protein